MTIDQPGDPATGPPVQGWGGPPPDRATAMPYPAYAAGPYAHPIPQTEPEPKSSLLEQARFVGVAAVAGVALGVLGAWLWSVIADPPVGVLTDRGVFLTDELSYDQQVVVSLWFLAIGTGLGMVGGLVAGLWGHRHGVGVVVAVLVMSVIACALSAWLGIEVFGPDPDAQVAAATVGDPITAALGISSKVAYLGWPIGGLVGLLIGVSTWTQTKVPNPVLPSSNVSPH